MSHVEAPCPAPLPQSIAGWGLLIVWKLIGPSYGLARPDCHTPTLPPDTPSAWTILSTRSDQPGIASYMIRSMAALAAIPMLTQENRSAWHGHAFEGY